MPPLPAKALQKLGYDIVRITGSHHRLKHPERPPISVQVHGNRDIPPGTLRSVIRATGLTGEKFLTLL
jgi:predicted RNA binding protein YcfA (HicA-like mRNA interferase family)